MKAISKYHDEKLPTLISAQVEAMEGINNRDYPTPNSNYLSTVRNFIDLLGTYADEVMALRQIALDAATLALDIRTDPKLVELDIYKHPKIKRIVDYTVKQPYYFMASNPKSEPDPQHKYTWPSS